MWKYLIEKEFKQFFRDPGLPRMALAFPVLMMLVFPFAVSMEIRNIDLAVVDNDTGRESSLLVEQCTSSGYFRLVTLCHDPDEAQRLMDENRADAILTILPGFDEEVSTGTGLPAGIKVNTVNGTKGSIGAQYISECVRMYLAGKNVNVPSDDTSRMEISEKYYFNPYMDYKLFMIPALIVIAITMITAFLPALNIVSEKEAGTIEQMNVTPVSKTAFITCITECLSEGRIAFIKRSNRALTSVGPHLITMRILPGPQTRTGWLTEGVRTVAVAYCYSTLCQTCDKRHGAVSAVKIKGTE